MEISAPFQEVNSYIKDRFHQPVTLSCLNEKEIRVTYTKHILIKNININVDLRIDEVTADSILLTYNGAMGLDMVIGGALIFLKNYLPDLIKCIHQEANHSIRINLQEIKKAKVVVENLVLKYINVEKSGLKIGLSLKIPSA